MEKQKINSRVYESYSRKYQRVNPLWISITSSTTSLNTSLINFTYEVAITEIFGHLIPNGSSVYVWPYNSGTNGVNLPIYQNNFSDFINIDLSINHSISMNNVAAISVNNRIWNSTIPMRGRSFYIATQTGTGLYTICLNYI